MQRNMCANESGNIGGGRRVLAATQGFARGADQGTNVWTCPAGNKRREPETWRERRAPHVRDVSILSAVNEALTRATAPSA